MLACAGLGADGRCPACDSFLIFVPLLLRGWNSAFFSFGDEGGVQNMNVIWQFGIIMVAFDLVESTCSRVVFNRSLKLDTFVDATRLIQVARAALRSAGD